MKVFGIAVPGLILIAVTGWAFARGSQEQQESSPVAEKPAACSSADKACCSQGTSRCQTSGACCAQQTSAAVAGETQTQEKVCPIAIALEKLPKMTYRVGDQVTCCDQAAAELAKSSGKPIQYVVGEKSFDTKEAAFVALVEDTEAYVTDFATPHVCETTQTTSIGGKSCGCPVQAEQTAKLIKDAMEGVAMTYQIDEQECHCPMQAREIATSTGKPITYVVAGQSTGCEYTARLNLAHARYKAALEALAKAEGNAAAHAGSDQGGSP